MEELKFLVEQIKKMELTDDANNLAKLFATNKEYFDSLEKLWFKVPNQSFHNDNYDKIDYKEQIASYIDLAISMYAKAIPHKLIKKISLLFSTDWMAGTEPKIRVEFDSNVCNIEIDELWQTELDLDRAMKEECVCLSGVFWYEYRPMVDSLQLNNDIQEVCQRLRRLYPMSEVTFSISD